MKNRITTEKHNNTPFYNGKNRKPYWFSPIIRCILTVKPRFYRTVTPLYFSSLSLISFFTHDIRSRKTPMYLFNV